MHDKPQRPDIPITDIERNKQAGHKADGQHQPLIGDIDYGNRIVSMKMANNNPCWCAPQSSTWLNLAEPAG